MISSATDNYFRNSSPNQIQDEYIGARQGEGTDSDMNVTKQYVALPVPCLLLGKKTSST